MSRCYLEWFEKTHRGSLFWSGLIVPFGPGIPMVEERSTFYFVKTKFFTEGVSFFIFPFGECF